MAKNNGMSILGLFLIIALLGLNVYQWMNNSKMKTKLNAKNTEYLELDQINTELNFNYEAKLEELEKLRGDNQDLNTKIDAQKEELAKQKRKVTSLIWTEKELGKARQAMADLNSQANNYIAEISKLKKDNEMLQNQNTELNQKNESLTEEVAVNKERISDLDSARSLLVSQTEELSAENSGLSSQVDMAEAIKINYIDAQGYDVDDDGSVKAKKRAKKVEMLRSCFTTETNLVTQPGEEEFFVTYIAPSGEVLWVEDLGSGTLKNKLNGETVRYTASGTVDYNNEDLKACLDWRPNFKLTKGTYQVEIYNNGFQVGKGSFALK